MEGNLKLITPSELLSLAIYHPLFCGTSSEALHLPPRVIFTENRCAATAGGGAARAFQRQLNIEYISKSASCMYIE